MPSCLDCPFRRDSEVDLPDEADPFDFYTKHTTIGDDGEYDLYICPGSEEVCGGLLHHLANSGMEDLVDPLSDLADMIEGVEVDRETYFWFASEFIRYHDGYWDGMFGAAWFIQKYGRGNKRATDPVPIISR